MTHTQTKPARMTEAQKSVTGLAVSLGYPGWWPARMTEAQKSVTLAGVVVLALVGTIVWLTRSPAAQEGPAPARAVGSQHRQSPAADHARVGANHVERGRAGLAATPAPPAPPPRATGAAGGLADREQFAGTMQDRMKQRGRELTIEAAGEAGTIFRLSWPAGTTDRSHLDALKRAEPLFAEARGQGFKMVMLRIGERVVWTRSLE